MHYPRCNTLPARTLNCRLLQRYFRDVAQTCKNHGYNDVADDLRLQPSSVVELALARDKEDKKVENCKKKKLSPYITYGLFQTKGEDVCKVWFRLFQKFEFV
jgi:hypothetical protein